MVYRNVMKCILVAATAILAISLGHNPAVSEPANRVTHYVVLVTGPGGWKDRSEDFWRGHESAYRIFKDYGYPDEAIYQLCEGGVTALPTVTGSATAADVRAVFKHLTQIMKDQDHLFVHLVGHGWMENGDWVFGINGGGLRATDLKVLLDAVPTQNITITISPCNSGGAIPKLSGPGRVIITSTSAEEENGHAWGIPELLARPKNGGRGPSIKQAYNATVDKVIADYHGKLKEHPMLNDNGDGLGHFGKAAVVDGNGALAAKRYLGNDGYKLAFQPSAIRELKQLNANLVLYDLSRIPKVFADQSVYLGSLGGYSDPGANSTRIAEHLAWAQHQTAPVIVENLVIKYTVQFDRQARLGEASAQRFYAEASARLASYGIDLGDPGANLGEADRHLEWAKRQPVPKLREGIEMKVRALLAGAADSPANSTNSIKAGKLGAMITSVAIAQAKPGKEKLLEETLLALVPQVRQEAGCINYDLHRSLSKPGVFIIYQNWVDRAALEKHGTMPYMLDFHEKAVDLLAGPLQIELYDMISQR